MMGFEEEAGVIPRFCQELFGKLASMENEEVIGHTEASSQTCCFSFLSKPV